MRKPTNNWVTCSAACHNYPATDYSWHISRWNFTPRKNVVAPENGKVIRAVLNDGARGKSVDFQVGNIVYEFSHFENIAVQFGKTYSEGALMGIMGKTGTATGVHLHLVIKVNGRRVPDPDVWLNARVEAMKPKPAGRIAKKGTATVTVPLLNVRNASSTSSPVQAVYRKGETFNYDSYIDSGGYRWLSYVSSTKVRRYVAGRNLKTGENHVSGGA